MDCQGTGSAEVVDKKPEVGHTLPLSPSRRTICDLLYFAGKVPSVPVQREINVAALREQLARWPASPSWCAIFTKAYGIVCQRFPELRRAYMGFPWPHLYEHPSSTASVAIERQYRGENAVFFAHLRRPEEKSLSFLQSHLRRLKEDPVETFGLYRRALLFSRLPRPLRRLAWWIGLNSSGHKRAKRLGTFGVSVYSGLGAESLHPLSPLTTTLNYGVIRPDGQVTVRIVYDHRVMDGSTVARALGCLDQVLNQDILDELKTAGASQSGGRQPPESCLSQGADAPRSEANKGSIDGSPMATPENNHWLDEACARAFWDQRQALPYQELLRDTARWLDPQPGEHWLDLGCGRAELTAVLWQLGQGRLAQVVAMDCNPVNAEMVERLRHKLEPEPAFEQLRFLTGNFSEGLPQFDNASFDGIVSGLAISYAESRDPVTGRYTDHAYNRLFAEMFRVLKPQGRLVFSVNVPRPRFWAIFWKSLRRGLRVSRPGRALLNVLKMQRYGSWLHREARRGRFHFLPIEDITVRLRKAGFEEPRHRLSYAGQAYIVSARKVMPAAAGAERGVLSPATFSV